MPEAVHRTPDLTTPRSTGFTLSAAHAGSPFWHSFRPAARRLGYTMTVLLGWVTILTLYDTIGGALEKGMPGAGKEIGFVIERFLNLLISLAPVMVFISLIGGIFPNRPFARIFWLTLGVAGSATAGVVINDIVSYGADAQWLLAHPRDVADSTIAILFPAGLLVAAYEFYRRGEDVAGAAFRIHADKIALQAEVSKARIQLLRAQIEPHFIFNSLAHVRRLYQIDPAKGHQMLASLIRYFGSAFPSLRQETCSLEQEAALIGAYLDIHCLRMGTRLVYEVAFPSNLCGLQIPTLMLLTLVENAIKHGLSPMPDGGFVRVSAVQTDTVLELRVADSGRGLTACSGRGTGLANIRARLNALYGSAAVLRLSTSQPCGITAVVRLPMSRVAA